MTYEEALSKFVELYQGYYDRKYAKSYTHSKVPRVYLDNPGSTLQRLCVDNGSQIFVLCFVAIKAGSNKAQGSWEVGDIFKPGGYKSPQPRGKRSSIFKEDPFTYGNKVVPHDEVPYWYEA